MSNQTSFLKLNAAFETGVSRPLGWRRKQIEGIHELIQKNTASLVSAATKDDRLSRTEVLLELASVLQFASKEVDNVVHYDKSRNTFSSTSGGVLGLGTHRERVAARSNPVGIVVIKSDWAYPYISLLGGMIAAFSAGNLCALVTGAPAIPSVLSSLLPHFLDHCGFAVLDTADANKEYMKLFDAVSPAITTLSVSPSGTVSVLEAASPTFAPSAAYVHESGDASAAGRALVHAKLAFNGQAPFAPSVAFVDDAVYDELCAAVRNALRHFPARRVSAPAGEAVGPLVERGMKVLSVSPLYVLEDSSKAAFTLPHGRYPFLILSRVSSPDTAVDKMKLMPSLSAFCLYAAEPFRSYVMDEVDSAVTVCNDVPLDMLVNPFVAYDIRKVLARPQQIVTVPRPSQLRLDDAGLALSLEKAILKASITHLDEGDGTRWDFFDQVKMVYMGVKYLSYAAALTSGYLIYRKYSK